MLDEDYGDITDPTTGRDLKVSTSKQPGKQYADTKFTPRATQTPLSKDQAQAKQWLTNVPNIDDYESLSSPDEIEKRVNDWLSGGSSFDEVGTVKGGPSKLSALEDEPRSSTPSQRTKPAPKNAFADLDDAFADLES